MKPPQPALGSVEALLKGLNIPRHYMQNHLTSEDRCPHCSAVMPTLELLWRSGGLIERGTPGPTHQWATYRCTRCGGVVLAKGEAGFTDAPVIIEVYPKGEKAHEDIPEPARTYLQEALDTLAAPNASVVIAGSAVDAMLKILGLEDGSVYKRIDQAVERHLITESMGRWAHSVRLDANGVRHADPAKPLATIEQARQSFEFAKALAYFLFVLSKQVEQGTVNAKVAEQEAGKTP